ncbi:MAG: hypothetical protein AB7I38_08040 [Dehalococcoidia bacterium]
MVTTPPPLRDLPASTEAWEPLTPAYYWAGRGSATVHRLKGFDLAVDEAAYDQAYSVERLRWLRNAGVNMLFLSYNWGLPPEMERDDWAAFSEVASTAHDLGIRAAAYVQPSNAFALGSFAARDWYAVTPKGKRIPYYNGRFFTCLNDEAWRTTVLERVADAIARGADAVFLDNCAFGGMPIPLSRDYTAFAGCYCARCQASFGRWMEARDLPARGVPRLFRPMRDPDAREFAHWRAWTLTEFLRTIRDTMLELDPRVVLLTNTVGAVNVNTYNLFGVDLPELAHVVDWLFVENLQSPRADQRHLVHNAGTFKLLQSLKPEASTLSISYERGIGIDGVPPARTFTRTLSEAYAAGGVPVVRATEYIEDRTWTVLQPEHHAAQLDAVRDVVDFVRGRSDLYLERRSAATVAVYVPPGLGWRGDVYPDHGSDFLAVIQALIGAAIPFRVVTRPSDLEGVRALLVPAGVEPPRDNEVLTIPFEQLGIRKRRRSLLDYFVSPGEPVLRRAGPWVVDGYFSHIHVRRFIDRLDLLFRLVFRDQFAVRTMTPAAAALLRGVQPFVVSADGPVYADLWENEAGLQLHLVNYGERPVRVQVTNSDARAARVITPAGETPFEGRDLLLDTYALILREPALSGSPEHPPVLAGTSEA